MKRALITGITGQDGSYLAEFLLGKGYEVHGLIRRASTFNTARIEHIFDRLYLYHGDMTDRTRLYMLLDQVCPDEVYNLAAQSHVAVSFDNAGYTAEVNFLGVTTLLDVLRDWQAPVRLYQASSSEMFGGTDGQPLNEKSPFRPRSPYAVAKVAAHWQAVNYRESYGLYVANGILFNHESPRRGKTFVTRKITRGLARVLAGMDEHIRLGTLAARRDWGFAGDYVRAMWMMLQQPEAGDFVVATGQARSVSDFLQLCCEMVNVKVESVLKIDPRYMRPNEVDCLLGDATKAREVLGWKPDVSFEWMAKMMLRNDLQAYGVGIGAFPMLEL